MSIESRAFTEVGQRRDLNLKDVSSSSIVPFTGFVRQKLMLQLPNRIRSLLRKSYKWPPEGEDQ